MSSPNFFYVASESPLLMVSKWVDEDSLPSEELQKQYSEARFSILEVNRQSLEDWYCLLRNLQNGKALQAIQNSQVKHLTESINFLKDGLFCEWAYFIDFENQKLETWKAGEMITVASFEELAKEGDSYLETLEREVKENKEGHEEEEEEPEETEKEEEEEEEEE